MKKLFAVVLILALLIPSVSFGIGDSPYFGKWIAQKHGSTANYDAILYYLYIHQNTPCAYYQFCLHHGGALTQAKISDSVAYADHWEIVDDHLRIPTSPIEYIDVFYDKESDTLYTQEWPKLTFVRIP